MVVSDRTFGEFSPDGYEIKTEAGSQRFDDALLRVYSNSNICSLSISTKIKTKVLGSNNDRIVFPMNSIVYLGISESAKNELFKLFGRQKEANVYISYPAVIHTRRLLIIPEYPYVIKDFASANKNPDAPIDMELVPTTGYALLKSDNNNPLCISAILHNTNTGKTNVSIRYKEETLSLIIDFSRSTIISEDENNA